MVNHDLPRKMETKKRIWLCLKMGKILPSCSHFAKNGDPRETTPVFLGCGQLRS